MRRAAPRPLRAALAQVASRAAPGGLLPRVQAVWTEVAGATMAEEAEPASERDGTVTVACRSAAWAHELDLLRGDLEGRLRDRLGGDSGAAGLRELRFVVREP
ncbi:MAG: DciA family protein [Thermoleophilaceae bacterium]